MEEPLIAPEAAPPPRKQRFVSLDIVRGLTVATMILVDGAGGPEPRIDHSPTQLSRRPTGSPAIAGTAPPYPRNRLAHPWVRLPLLSAAPHHHARPRPTLSSLTPGGSRSSTPRSFALSSGGGVRGRARNRARTISRKVRGGIEMPLRVVTFSRPF